MKSLFDDDNNFNSEYGLVMRKVALLGGGKGLSYHFALRLQQEEPETEVLCLGRHNHELTEQPHWHWQQSDFGDPEQWGQAVQKMSEFGATHVFYFAGGGPYGDFLKKEWKDHEWAWNVSFKAASFFLHQLGQTDHLQQFVLLGSSIASEKADPGASSYAAAKHALLGLFKSLQKEDLFFDLRLYAPGYMDSPMLPVRSAPRQSGNRLWSLSQVAQDLYSWSKKEGEEPYKELSAFADL